jgi:hypothetical protein
MANASVVEERNYPESAISSSLRPTIKDPALKAELFFKRYHIHLTWNFLIRIIFWLLRKTQVLYEE